MASYKELTWNKWLWSLLSISIAIPLLFDLTDTPLFSWVTTGDTAQVMPTQLIQLPTSDTLLQLQDQLVVQSAGQQVTTLGLTVTNLSSTTFIDLDRDALQIAYRDSHQHQLDLSWTWRLQGHHDQDHLLEAGEAVQLTVRLDNHLHPPLGPHTSFALDITSPNGAIITWQGVTPDQLAPTMQFP